MPERKRFFFCWCLPYRISNRHKISFSYSWRIICQITKSIRFPFYGILINKLIHGQKLFCDIDLVQMSIMLVVKLNFKRWIAWSCLTNVRQENILSSLNVSIPGGSRRAGCRGIFSRQVDKPTNYCQTTTNVNALNSLWTTFNWNEFNLVFLSNPSPKITSPRHKLKHSNSYRTQAQS